MPVTLTCTMFCLRMIIHLIIPASLSFICIVHHVKTLLHIRSFSFSSRYFKTQEIEQPTSSIHPLIYTLWNKKQTKFRSVVRSSKFCAMQIQYHFYLILSTQDIHENLNFHKTKWLTNHAIRNLCYSKVLHPPNHKHTTYIPITLSRNPLFVKGMKTLKSKVAPI